MALYWIASKNEFEKAVVAELRRSQMGRGISLLEEQVIGFSNRRLDAGFRIDPQQ
jgi:hypothetical protein